MDIALLVKFLAPCLPFLLKVGNKAVEGASEKVGEDVWNKGKVIWAKLLSKSVVALGMWLVSGMIKIYPIITHKN
jgi:hypothetical protein